MPIPEVKITPPTVRLDWQDLGAEAARLVAELENEDIPGAAKRRRVLDALAKQADEAVTWGSGPIGRLFEALDRWIVRLILTGIVEGAVAARKAIREAA